MNKSIRKILLPIGNFLLPLLMGILCSSLKFSYSDDPKIYKSPNKFVFAFWHGTMLIPWYFLKNQKTKALVSQSKDGELLTSVLKFWNYEIFRGSSNKGGKEAFEMLLNNLNKSSIAITPDGPKGPVENFKPGAVIAAKKTDNHLVLIGVGIKNKWQLNSWDKFQIPKPFSEVRLEFSKPLSISSELNFDETSEIIKEAEKYLTDLQRKAEAYA